ncbi:Ubiquitin-conjugating enzyme, E2 [Corchorus olitorius]|uniref:E2 ubiquitin-conjugating enzyme n=1 Tax=Corchorus olitorius TaxID=93759 RepID=A0A1R3IK04_9ROSI|nr:Ubiquitin-conjugating enzyme, E2 [Corchorus olitorius]
MHFFDDSCSFEFVIRPADYVPATALLHSAEFSLFSLLIRQVATLVSFGTSLSEATNENLPPNVIKQLAKELKSLDESPPEGIKVGVNDDDFSIIYADIEGPAGTPYENGVFRMKLLLSHDFPHSPPKGYFLTKIFHPNIATNGEICVNTLKKDWNPSLGLRHVLIVVRCLLIEPFPESALNEQAGKMLLENYDEYARHARLYTGIHAKPKPKFKSGAICESTTALNVDQSNTSVLNVDQKNASNGAALPLPSAVTLSTAATKGGNIQEQQSIIATADTGVSGTAIVGTDGTTAIVGTAPKKEVLTKVQADKKKMDARKKSLKRL